MPESTQWVVGDEVLLERIAKGDQAAFEALVRAWTARLFSLCLRVLRDQQQAEEVVQDAFLKIWQSASSYSRDRGRGSSWIFSIAHHQAIDRVRGNRARGAYLANPSESTSDMAVAAPEGVDVWQKMRMNKALQALNESQRQVIYLAYFEGLTRAEIATLLGEPVGTVKTRLRDALIKLRENFVDPSAVFQSLDRNPPLSST